MTVGMLRFLRHTFDAYRDDLRLAENDLPHLAQLADGTKYPIAARALLHTLERLDLSGVRGRKPRNLAKNWAVRAELRVGEGGGFNAKDLHVVLGPPSALHTDAVSLGRPTTVENATLLLELQRPATGGIVVYENRLPNLAHFEPYDVFVAKSADGPWVHLGIGRCDPDGDRFYFGNAIDSARFVWLRDRGESTGPNGSPCAGADIKAVMGFDRAEA